MRSGTLVGIAFVFGYFAAAQQGFLPWAIGASIVLVAVDIVLEHLGRA